MLFNPGVLSFTAGAGEVNSGSAIRPISDVVAANSSITVNADSIQLGATVPTATLFSAAGTALQVTNNFEVDGVALIAGGTFAVPGIAFVGDADTGVFSSVANNWAVATAGTSRFNISTTQINLSLQTAFLLGNNAAPSASFTGDLDTGMYSSGADNIDWATGGTNRANLNSTAWTTTVPHYAPAGAVGAPAFSFSGDTNTGAYSVAADTFGIATNGALIVEWTTGQELMNTLGAAATPAWSFVADPNTGIFSSAADTLDASTGGTSRWTLSTTSLTTTLQQLGGAGSNAAPNWSFSGDPDTGMYSASANQLGFATNGAVRLTLTTTTASFAVVVSTTLGALTAPSYTFSGDSNTGMWSSGADAIDFSTGGGNRMRMDSTGNVSVPASMVIGTTIGTTPDQTLDVRGEISIFGASASLARLRLRGFYAASPADPPASQTDIMVVDTGAAQVLRVRYNDAGSIRVGDLALV